MAVAQSPHPKSPSSVSERTIPIGRFSRPKLIRRLILLVFIAGLWFVVVLHTKSATSSVKDVMRHYLSHDTKEQISFHESRLKVFETGLRQCASIKEHPISQFDSARTNPRAVKSAAPIVIRNATIIDGDGSIFDGYSILLSEGIVSGISQNLEPPKDAKFIDVGGRYVSPGIVDMHSHAGVDSLPELFGTDDYNEIVNDVTPYVRTIDAINPSDEMLYRISSGGVTTSLILPGSANNIGGEAYVLKLRRTPTLSVEDMLIQHNVTTKRERWVKMACGENPKRVYGRPLGRWPGGPYTRLGEAWRFRHTFEQAQELMKAQDEWCLKAEAAASMGRLSSLTDTFPSNLELDAIASFGAMLETMDLEAMLRHSSEFDFQITAFHHALDAWRVPEMIRKGGKSRNITVATFGLLWGYKKEAYQANPWAGKILSDHNIPLAYKSDHPVLNAQHLLYEAQIGHHYGVPEDLAIASLTSVPAAALGMDHRIGFVREGYDADLVIWDSHPLALGATPIQVFIDGVPIFDEDEAEKKLRRKPLGQNVPSQRIYDEVEAMSGRVDSKAISQTDFIASGIQKAFIRTNDGLHSVSATSQPLTMVVKQGNITCLSTSCVAEMGSARLDGVQTYDLKNGYLLPGLTILSSAHGLMDIEAEISTVDGFVDPNRDPTKPSSVIYAKDGLAFDGKHLERAQAAGILNLVTAPLSGGFLQGVSVAFKASGTSVLDEGAVIQEEVALHFAIGHESNGGNTRSISSQIETLRKLLIESANATDETIYRRAASGKIPLAVTTHNKDIIAHLLKMKAEIEDTTPINLVIIGGIESYLIAKELAKAKIPVILTPWRCKPEAWEYRHCLPGPPISEKTSFQILIEHGVEVALGAWDEGLLTTMYWEAGWAAKGTTLSEGEIVGLISTNVEKILGIKWDENASGGHVLFEGNPLDFGATLIAVV